MKKTALLVLLFFAACSRERIFISDFSWERIIHIEKYKWITEEDWHIPTGGIYLSERQAVHHYDTTCLPTFDGEGNVGIDCSDDPVYATKYAYKIRRWVHDRDVRAAGTTDRFNLCWPEFIPKNKERESSREEHYYIHLSQGGDGYIPYEVAFKEWLDFNLNQIFLAKIFQGRILDLKSPEKYEE